MIEPFEFETIRLQAPLPTGETGKSILRGKGSVDEEELKSFSTLTNASDDLKLDTQQIHIYQTKIGNPKHINSHEASLVQERVMALGTLGPKYETPLAKEHPSQTTSELLHTFLDSEMSFVPRTDLHQPPSFAVNSPDTPFLNPGLTTIDSRKVSIHWK